MPQISVIITAYNEEKFIEECIYSVTNQSYRDIEIIIVDDGSTDRTGFIADLYASKDSRVVVAHKKNGGLVSARKAGIAIAKAPRIFYIDGDDWLDLNCFEKLMNIVEMYDPDIITCGYINEAKTSTICNSYLPTGMYKGQDLIRYVFPNMLAIKDWPLQYGIYPFLCDKLFKKDVLYDNQLRVPDGVVKGEDVVASYKTILESSSVVVSDICGYHYRRHSESLTMHQRKEGKDELNLRHRIIRKQFENEYKDVLLPQFYTYYWHNLTQQCFEDLFDKHKNVFLPFLIHRGEKVVLYGMGKMCKKIEAILEGFCSIVAYTDRSSIKTHFDMEKVISFEDISKIDYDKIVITIDNLSVQDDVASMLTRCGIPKEKISKFKMPFEVDKYLEELLYE